MIEQFYPWYWKFYDMAEDEGGGYGDDDTDDTDDTGEDEAGETGEDAPPSEDTDMDRGYGADMDAPITTAPIKQVVIDVSTIQVSAATFLIHGCSLTG